MWYKACPPDGTRNGTAFDVPCGEIASLPSARKIEGSAWYTLFAHARSLLGNLHTIRYTNYALTKQSASVYLLLSHTAELCSL